MAQPGDGAGAAVDGRDRSGDLARAGRIARVPAAGHGRNRVGELHERSAESTWCERRRLATGKRSAAFARVRGVYCALRPARSRCGDRAGFRLQRSLRQCFWSRALAGARRGLRAAVTGAPSIAAVSGAGRRRDGTDRNARLHTSAGRPHLPDSCGDQSGRRESLGADPRHRGVGRRALDAGAARDRRGDRRGVACQRRRGQWGAYPVSVGP